MNERQKAQAVVAEARALADAIAAEDDRGGHSRSAESPDFWRTVVACADCHATAPSLPTDPFFISFGVCCERDDSPDDREDFHADC